MPKPTIQSRYRDGILASGGYVVRQTANHILMGWPNTPIGLYLILGPSGSLRYGRSRTNSRVVSDKSKAKILEAATDLFAVNL